MKMNTGGRPGRGNTGGCYVHDDCLTCPLAVCIEDMDPSEQRDMRISLEVREMTEHGMTLTQAVQNLAERLGMKDASNIYRRLKRQRLREKPR